MRKQKKLSRIWAFIRL